MWNLNKMFPCVRIWVGFMLRLKLAEFACRTSNIWKLRVCLWRFHLPETTDFHIISYKNLIKDSFTASGNTHRPSISIANTTDKTDTNQPKQEVDGRTASRRTRPPRRAPSHQPPLSSCGQIDDGVCSKRCRVYPESDGSIMQFTHHV